MGQVASRRESHTDSIPNPGSVAPKPLAVGDFNGDGKPDLAVGNFSGGTLNQGSIGILLNNGDRTLVCRGLHANIPLDVAVADVNADGKLDVVAANENIDSASVLLGTGTVRFRPQQRIRPPINLTGFVLPISTETQNQIWSHPLWWKCSQHSPGKWKRHVSNAGKLPTGTTPIGIVAKELNADNKQDIVVAVANSNAVYVYIGNGDGTFPASVSYPVGSGPSNLASGI